MYEATIEVNRDCEFDTSKWIKPGKSESLAPPWSQRSCTKCGMDCSACDRRRSSPCHNSVKNSTNNCSTTA